MGDGGGWGAGGGGGCGVFGGMWVFGRDEGVWGGWGCGGNPRGWGADGGVEVKQGWVGVEGLGENLRLGRCLGGTWGDRDQSVGVFEGNVGCTEGVRGVGWVRVYRGGWGMGV